MLTTELGLLQEKGTPLGTRKQRGHKPLPYSTLTVRKMVLKVVCMCVKFFI